MNLRGCSGTVTKGNLDKANEEKEVKENEELDEEEEDMKERVCPPGIEPTISEVEVEGANQWATPSQTKLR